MKQKEVARALGSQELDPEFLLKEIRKLKVANDTLNRWNLEYHNDLVQIKTWWFNEKVEAGRLRRLLTRHGIGSSFKRQKRRKV